MKINFPIDSESYEQACLVKRLDLNNYTYTSFTNDVRIPSIKQRAKMKALGLRPGISDLLIVLHSKSLLFLEVKKKRGPKGGNNGSVISKHQLKWQNKINDCKNCEYVIAHGFDECIEIIERYENV